MSALQTGVLYSVILLITIILASFGMRILDKISESHFLYWYIPYCIIIWIIFSVYWIAPYL